MVKKIISEKLWIDDALMLERMGLSAKSYIAEPAGVNYDEADVSKDTLFYGRCTLTQSLLPILR